MALPNWFPPVKIGPIYSPESLTGGAFSFSNPTKQALDEARRTFGAEAKASIILSLGSGHRRPRSLDSATMDLLDDMAHSGEQIEDELSERFRSANFYQRFSVSSGLENLSATSWTADDLGTITSHSKTYIEKGSSSLFATAELLTKNQGFVTLGQLSEPFILYPNHY